MHVAVCTGQGDITFQSDSMSTIAIVKEVITKMATAKKVCLPHQRDRVASL